jgi:hypothetical protein
MMFNTIQIEEKDEKVYVHVELAPRHENTGVAKMACTSSDVAAELEKREIVFGECLEGKKLRNWREDTRKGTFVFSKKVLDKPVEDVILEVEKEVKPKPARKKRTRTSTKKKVSTGE